MNIYVGNLAYTLTEDELRDAFSEFGEVANVNLIIDRYTGKSKGFAFVDMPNDKEALDAIDQLNDVDLKGRNMKVNKAKPRKERPDQRPRYNDNY